MRTIEFSTGVITPDSYKRQMRCFTDTIHDAKRTRILQWPHNVCDGISNHQPHDCLLNCLFRCRSKKISNLRVTGLCVGNSPVPGEFPAQITSNAENVSIWWRHHERFELIASSEMWLLCKFQNCFQDFPVILHSILSIHLHMSRGQYKWHLNAPAN